jgi:hypothetical protein
LNTKFFLIIFYYFYLHCATHEKIKIYSFYTPSHTLLVDTFFLPSVPADCQVKLSLYEQISPHGDFMEPGWNETMLFKIETIIKGIEENWGGFFIHADVDIQFFGPLTKIIALAIKNYDMLIQKDSPQGTLCAGFFVCKGNAKTLSLWKEIRAKLRDKEYLQNDPYTNDQEELNELLFYSNPYELKWDYLPDSFFGAGLFTGTHWYKGDQLSLPKDIVMHHANYTSGIENKMAQLAYVKEQVYKDVTF